MEGESSAPEWESELLASTPQAEPQENGNERQIPSSNSDSSRPCESCEKAPATIYCKACNTRYCRPCFNMSPPHRKRVTGHEPIRLSEDGASNRDDSGALKDVLSRPRDTDNPGGSNQESTPRDEPRTLWLYVPKPDDEGLTLKTSPRFERLIEQHQTETRRGNEERDVSSFPRLVSFIGATGAGKSSLIRALINHKRDSMAESESGGFEGPLSGKMGSPVPMSSDVHLFRDPSSSTQAANGPLLYADCEGLKAPSNSVVGALLEQHIQKIAAEKEAPEEVKDDPKKCKAWARDKFDSAMGFAKRRVSGSDRSDTIREIFPRILYTISDVIVYVLPAVNLPSMGEFLKDLLKWSECAETSSLNKGFSPSLLIVINRSDETTKTFEEMESYKGNLLDQLNSLMDEDAYLRQRRALLQQRNFDQINSLKDMLGHSYAQTRIMQIPSDDSEQWGLGLEVLYQTLLTDQVRDHSKRKISLSGEHLAQLHELTFEHFSSSPNRPFDFARALSKVRPPPPTLSGTCFALLEASFDAAEGNLDLYLSAIKEWLIPMVCSSVALDCHRRKIKGDLVGLYNGPESAVNQSYKASIDKACENFSQDFLPCGSVLKINGKVPLTLTCVSNMNSHGDMHRDASGNPFLGENGGQYNTGVKNSFHELWNEEIKNVLKTFNEQEIPAIRNLQRTAIRKLHHNASVDLRRLPSCVWCMANIPTERLSCGHWICSSCIIELGEEGKVDDRLFVIKYCDQHHNDAQSSHGLELQSPLQFLSIPQSVGRRVLSLDDGGVRGILQLKLLQALQNKLGKNLPIQDCFDLIGGDGFGGVIALGLGLQGLEASITIAKFTELVNKALAKKGPWILKWWPDALKWGYYRSNDLEKDFKDPIEQDANEGLGGPLFSMKTSGANPTRLFVISGRDRTIFTNYNRPSLPSSDVLQPLKYLLKLEEEASKVASKTVASQQYYKGGVSKESLGPPAEIALFEAGALWPRKAKDNVDLLVSIACGHEVDSNKGDKNSTWLEASSKRAKEAPDRYIRLSPEFSLGTLPRTDETSYLKKNVSSIIPPLQGEIDRVFRQLISSSFYFERKLTSWTLERKVTISGCIRCRFRNGAEITKALGCRILNLANPRFRLINDQVGLECPRKDLQAVLKQMRDKGVFRLPGEGVYDFESMDEDNVSVLFMADDM